MDYEKKYNEALEWMREMYPCLTGSMREDAEHFFPELAGSEDERIRNLIYCLIRDRSDNQKLLEHNGVSVDKALAYLEKQKEQKPVEWSEEDKNAITIAIRACRYMTENFENSTKQYEDAIERLKSLHRRFAKEDEK